MPDDSGRYFVPLEGAFFEGTVSNFPNEEDSDYVIQVVLDAIHLGEAAAMEKHHCSHDTVWRYKKIIRTDPVIAKQYAALYIQLNRESLAKALKAKDKALTLLIKAMEASTSLKDQTAAFKAITEAQLAETIAMGFGASNVEAPVEEPKMKRAPYVRRNHESPEDEGASESVREAGDPNAPRILFDEPRAPQ